MKTDQGHVIAPETRSFIAGFVAQVNWQFAKTMPDWPHEYTVRTWGPDLDQDFSTMCGLIRAAGIAEPWPPPPARPIYHNRYLLIGGFKYWAMGANGDTGPIDQLNVLNRVALGEAG